MHLVSGLQAQIIIPLVDDSQKPISAKVLVVKNISHATLCAEGNVLLGRPRGKLCRIAKATKMTFVGMFYNTYIKLANISTGIYFH